MQNLGRRAALGTLAAGLLTPALARAQVAEGQPLPFSQDSVDPVARRMGWAVVGLGSYGVGQVLPSFLDARRSRMTAFVSGNPDKARMLGERYGVERFYDYATFDDLAFDPQVECVYIVLPVGLHAEYTIRALKAGKHVLCEKPMASTPAECEAMIAAARAADRRLGVAYRVHFEPNNRAVQARIAAGDLGTMRFVSADHGFDANPDYPPHAWRLTKALGGGGSMYDIGVYGLNTSLMMLPDDTPVSVSAVYSTPKGDPRFAEVEGGLEWRLRMRSGISVQGSSSYCWSPYVSRQRYFGSKASIEMQPATTYEDNRIILEGGGQPPRHFVAGDPNLQFAAQLDGFTDAVRAGREHLTPGEMGLRDMQLIAAMYRSADAGGEPVAV